MEENLDIVVNPTSAQRGINALIQTMSRLHSTTSQAQGATTALFNAMGKGIAGFESAILNFKSVLLGFGSVIAVFRQLGAEFTKFQAFTSALSVSVGGAKEARAEYQFLIDMADRLGISVTSLQHNYGQLAAATKASGISMESLRGIFESFSVAARVLHLGGQDTRLMFYALTQMVSKGTVSMEELRRQLGEKIPGAMNIAASSVGATVEQFEAAVRKGSVSAAKFLPIFADAIKQSFIGGLPNAMTAFDAEINRLINNLQKIVVTMMDMGVAQSFTNIIKELNRVLSDPQIVLAFADGVKKISDGVTVFLKSISGESIRKFIESFVGGAVSIGNAITEHILPFLKEVLSVMGEIIKAWATIKGAQLGAQLGGMAGGKGAAVGGILGGIAGYAGADLLLGRVENQAAQLGAKKPVHVAEGKLPDSIVNRDNTNFDSWNFNFEKIQKAKLSDVQFEQNKAKERDAQMKKYEAALLALQKKEVEGNIYSATWLDIKANKYSLLTDKQREALLNTAAEVQMSKAIAEEEKRKQEAEKEIDQGTAADQKERERFATKFAALQEEMLAEEELLYLQFERELEIVNEAERQKIGTQEQWNEARYLIEERFQDKLAQLHKKKMTEQERFMAMSYEDQAKVIFGELEAITAGVAQHNKAMFQINKVSGIANAIISAHQGAARSLATYPWPLAGIMAAIHYAAGLARVKAIAGTSFNGGGSGNAPSVAGSAPATPVTPIVEAPQFNQQPTGPATTIILRGQVFDEEQIRELVEKINETRRNGGRLELA